MLYVSSNRIVSVARSNWSGKCKWMNNRFSHSCFFHFQMPFGSTPRKRYLGCNSSYVGSVFATIRFLYSFDEMSNFIASTNMYTNIHRLFAGRDPPLPVFVKKILFLHNSMNKFITNGGGFVHLSRMWARWLSNRVKKFTKNIFLCPWSVIQPYQRKEWTLWMISNAMKAKSKVAKKVL